MLLGIRILCALTRSSTRTRTRARALSRFAACAIGMALFTAPCAGATTISTYVMTNQDDGAVQRSTTTGWGTNCTAQSSDSHGVSAGTNDAMTRFREVAVPQGTTISNATVTYQVTLGTSATVRARIDDTDTSAPLASSGTEVCSRTTLAAGAPTTLTPVAGEVSMDVTSLVQTELNRPGWSSGNAMSIFLESTAVGDNLTFDQIESGAAGRARLDITYAATPPMTIDSGPRSVVAPGQATIWWYSSSTGSSELKWGSSPGKWTDLPNDASNTATALGTLHSRTISNLPAGKYYYRVRSAGAAGTATSTTHSLIVTAGDASTPMSSVAFNNSVYAATPDATNSTLYVGGLFTAAGQRVGNGFGIDASTAGVGTGLPQIVGITTTAVGDGAGGFYVGGAFTRVGGFERHRIAHILPDGGVDPYFDVGANDLVNALYVTGTTLYVGGNFTTLGTSPRAKIGSIDLTSSTVTQWNPGADGVPTQFQASGSTLYVAGAFTHIGGQPRTYVASFDTTAGSLNGWAPVLDGPVYSFALNGSSMYLGGAFTHVGATLRNHLAEVDPTTAALAAWDPNVNAPVYAVAYTSSTVYATGDFTTVNNGGSTRAYAAAFNGLGTATAWDPHLNGTAFALAPYGSTMFIGGYFTTTNNGTNVRQRIAQTDLTTGMATGWAPQLNNEVDNIAIEGSTVFAAGYANAYAMSTRNGAAAIDIATGTITPWNPNVTMGGTKSVLSIVVNGSSVYVGGNFAMVGGASHPGIAQVDATTGAANAWNPGLNGSVSSMALSGGILYTGGAFTVSNAVSRTYAVAYDTTNSNTQTGWAPQLNSLVRALVVSGSGSTIYLGGQFTTASGGSQVRNHLAAYDTSGTLQSWNPSATGGTGNVDALVLGPGSTIYAGGAFTTMNSTSSSVTRNGLAELDATPTNAAGAATGWNPNANGEVNALARMGSTIIAGGSFTTVNSQPRSNFAALDATTAVPSELKFDASYSVQVLTPVGTRLYMGGQWGSTADGQFGNLGFAWIDTGLRDNLPDAGALTITQPPQHTVVPYQTTVCWTTSASSSSELVWDNASHGAWSDYAYDASNTGTNLGLVHSRTISNLSAGTYFYRVRSRNASGDQVTSSEYSFTVTSPDAATPLNTTVFDGAVNSSATSDDNATLYVGGTFTRAGERAGSAITTSATNGETTQGSPQVVGTTMAAVSDGDGGAYIAGNFLSVGGLPRTRIAHILPDGGVDPTWTASASANVTSLVRSGTTLYVGGLFSTLGGQARSNIGAIDTTTGLATPWNPNANGNVQTMVLVGSTMYVGGTFTTIGGQSRTALAALDTTSDTNNATSWTPAAPNSAVNAIVIDSGLVYIGGTFNTVGGVAHRFLAAIDQSSGTVQPWTSDVTGSAVNTLALNGSTLYVGGSFSALSGSAKQNLGAVNTTSGAATTWNPGVDGAVYTAQLSGNLLVIGGSFSTAASVSRVGTASLDTTVVAGTASSWTAGVTDSVRAILLNGPTTLVAGYFRGDHAVVRMRVAAIDTATNTVTSWNPGVTDNAGFVRAIAQRGGTVYVGGNYSTIGGQTRHRLAAVDAVTGAVRAWDADIPSGVVNAIAVDVSNTTVYAAGSFTTVNGSTTRNNIAAFGVSDGIATAWDPNASSGVNTIILNGSTLFVGGSFSTIGGQARSELASLDTSVNTGNATGWTPNVTGGSVTTMVLTGTTLWVGGSFSFASSAPRTNMASYDTSTGALNAWNPGANGLVKKMASANHTLYAAGDFTIVGGQARGHAASFDISDGTLTDWDPNLHANSSSEYGIAAVGNTVYVGGAYGDAHNDAVAQSGLYVYDACDRSTYCADDELRDYLSMTMSSPMVTMKHIIGDISSTGTSVVTVRSNAADGYTLTATDTSDTAALTCSTGACTGQSIADWTGTDSTPTTWAAADTGTEYGFGATVLSTTYGTKESKWGTGTTATDFANNRYVGLRVASSTTLHSIDRYLGNAADTTTIGWRARIGAAQIAGTYTGTVTITAVPNA